MSVRMSACFSTSPAPAESRRLLCDVRVIVFLLEVVQRLSAHADLGHTQNNTVTARLKQQEEQKNFSPIFFFFFLHEYTNCAAKLLLLSVITLQLFLF